MLFPILGPSSLSVVVAQPDERHANRTASVLEWYLVQTKGTVIEKNIYILKQNVKGTVIKKQKNITAKDSNPCQKTYRIQMIAIFSLSQYDTILKQQQQQRFRFYFQFFHHFSKICFLLLFN